jgi:tetratricopeptide (TPR) repeat protein
MRSQQNWGELPNPTSSFDDTMTKYLKFAVIASFTMMPLAVAAQDDSGTNDSNADDFAGPTEQTVPVADEVAAPENAPEAVTEERLLEEFARYRRLVQEKTFDEADVAAKRIVEMAIRVYGPQSRETASALNNLGIVQHSTGQFDPAIQNFTSAVEILEIVEDRLNDSLINPLKGLGAAQLGSGRPDLALQTFTRATHITHVNEGPHNLDQVEILESVAETHIRMGDTKGARDILDRIHVINVKQFEKNPMGLLPSLMNRASWQHRAGYYGDERSTYRRAIRIVETSDGKNSPMLVEPLRRLGESFYYLDNSMTLPQQQGMVSSGEMYFKRAARIAQKSEDFGWKELADSQLALADYYTFTDSLGRSRKIYLEIWELLSSDEERLALRGEWFSEPTAIRTEVLPVVVGRLANGNSTRDDMMTGTIYVDYSVSSEGRVRKIKTLSNPPEFSDMQRTVHREIRRRIYRPRLVDGVATETEGMHFEHRYSYLKADLDAIREAAGESSDDKNNAESAESDSR